MGRLATPQIRFVAVRPPEPEKLRVLYLTANPKLDLRTETEVRLVQQSLRAAKYRDLVEIQQRSAATFGDLIDGLNDIRPHIVHFSGHGGGQSILFGSIEDSAHVDPADSPGSVIGFHVLMEALAATDTPPQLLVLNACDTLEGAGVILPAVPVVVAMSSSVSDLASGIFAQHFYAAIASSQSVGSALKQARVSMKAVDLDDDALLPQQVAREGVDIDTLVLVRRPAGSG
jgi:CHAT domain-containing protein